jgi:hypothetical protein
MTVLPNPFEFTPMAASPAVVPPAASALAPLRVAAGPRFPRGLNLDVLEEILSFPPIDLDAPPLFLRAVR